MCHTERGGQALYRRSGDEKLRNLKYRNAYYLVLSHLLFHDGMSSPEAD